MTFATLFLATLYAASLTCASVCRSGTSTCYALNFIRIRTFGDKTSRERPFVSLRVTVLLSKCLIRTEETIVYAFSEQSSNHYRFSRWYGQSCGRTICA